MFFSSEIREITAVLQLLQVTIMFLLTKSFFKVSVENSFGGIVIVTDVYYGCHQLNLHEKAIYGCITAVECITI